MIIIIIIYYYYYYYIFLASSFRLFISISWHVKRSVNVTRHVSENDGYNGKFFILRPNSESLL